MFTLQTNKIKTRRSRGIYISNKRNELITKCRHVNKFLLKIYKSRRRRRGRGKGRGRWYFFSWYIFVFFLFFCFVWWSVSFNNILFYFRLLLLIIVWRFKRWGSEYISLYTKKLIKSWKLCLNLWSRKWLKPRLGLVLVINFIPLVLWQL